MLRYYDSFMALWIHPRFSRRPSRDLRRCRGATWIAIFASFLVSAGLASCAAPAPPPGPSVDGAGAVDPARIEAECRLEAVGRVRRAPYYDSSRGRGFPGDDRSTVRRDLDEQHYFRQCMKRRGLE